MTAANAILEVAVLTFAPTTVVAYLDAGTGGMLLQLLLGGVAGIAVVGKLYWHRVKTALGFKVDEPSTERNDRASATDRE
ncbi:MAG: hypothetical protein ACREDZ_15865 [Kiloniellales bacterium]